MKLSQLVQHNFDDFEIKSLTDDSRLVKKGDVFVLEAKLAPDPEAYIAMALEKGAAAVISNHRAEGVIFHASPGAVLAVWARAQSPKQPENLVAVTGTNGKTSVTWFYGQLMQAAGYKTATLGTLGIYVNNIKEQETGYTSPTALKLHPILQEMAEKNITHACLEASSQALDVHRLEKCCFKAAALTNITQDHLDYHGTMEAYAAAKYRLFSELLPEEGTAVLNIQRPESWPLAALCKERGLNLITYGSGNAELMVSPTDLRADGQTVDVKYGEAAFTLDLPLVGTFQAQNVAAAMGLALATGATMEGLEKALPNLANVPGRMEVIPKQNEGQPTVLVDYAHTPDALENALQSVRPLTKGKLWVLVGCGGNRDVGKRPKMGKIASDLADVVVITDDNPRHEEAAKIRQQMLKATTDGQEIGDREEAIRHALTQAGADDVVLIAGKGHESGQIIGEKTLPFDDRDVARKILSKSI